MDTGGIAGDLLRNFVERYERLQEEIDALNDDRSELMKEVESAGFDKKALKLVIRRRRDPAATKQEDMFVALYEAALAVAEGTEIIDGLSRAPARARETQPPSDAMTIAVRDWVDNVPEDTTVSIVAGDGKGFAVANRGGHRTVRQFGEEEPSLP